MAALEKACSLPGRNPSILGSLAMAYGRAGESTKALNLLAELNELARRRYVSPAAFESVYGGLGDLDCQFEYLEKSYQERNNSLAHLAVNPGRERVLADPRGRELWRRLGLSQ